MSKETCECAQRANASQTDAFAVAGADELSFQETVEAVAARIRSNRANSLGLCACLAVCDASVPYREAEALIAERPELRLSTQNAHVLLQIMIDCGGVAVTDVPELGDEAGEVKQDMPIDYTVQTTEAGREALRQFDPSKRFRQTLNEDPEVYGQVYAAVLELCLHGARKADIEQMLQGNQALNDPKQVYPSYFISKLETIGGLVWDGSWKTTEAGRQMLSMVG